MNVDSIKNGVVIDHITAGDGMKIYYFLGLDKLDCPIALIKNAMSRNMGRKDIIKVDSENLPDLCALGYIAPDVTVNVIKDGEIIKKYHPELPEQLADIVKCQNPRCITSTEQERPDIYSLTDRENRVHLCIYCESKAKG